MKIRGKKFISLGLATMITMSTCSVFANTANGFKDVPSNHWAKQYIDSVSKEGLFTGYENNIFKPEESISRSQVIILLTRLVKPDQGEVNQAKIKYESALTKAFVPEWAKAEIASALSRGIIQESELSTLFNKDGSQPKAIRSEVCKYLTRVLGLENEAKSKTTFNLPFKDSEKIKKDDMPYISIMSEKKIINGDSNGNFNPNNSLTRSEMAKVLSVANDYRKGNTTTPGVTTQVKGTIYSIINNATNSNEMYLTIRDTNYNLVGYTINTNTKFYIDNKTTSINDFAKDMEVTLEVTQDKKVVSMKTDSITEDYEGTVYGVSTSDNTMTVEYKISKNSDKTERKTFKVDSNAKIKIDGKTGYLKNISKGDSVEITVVNTKITDIDVDSKNKEIEGVIKEIEYKKETILTIKGDDKETYKYPVKNKATIKRNRKTASIDDLRRGDEVEITVEDDEITEIYAESVDKDDKGTITGMKYTSSGVQITISNNDDDESSYYISKGARVSIDGERKSTSDIKLGQYVELEIEGEEVVSVKASEVSVNDSVTGIIEYINKNAEVVTVLSIDSGNKKEVQVSLYDANIIDSKGNTVRFSSLKEGDTVTVVGNHDGRILNAATAIVLSYKK
ncbi:S-layer domain-containing protein [Gottschalkia acidurici 9a]|uniref:S-layer domain-containing protein n=1 Tax=Gottschalkia acidurici (strain ATCC 7906 / DSM 604 / BCRC 14475 / CIP 104303 / KCTC 5404 / NCIMB 10678 / 9a) TaxID=1128398 RepID=K0AWY4_GOTA9|nr:S-layer homology domain-containing protein [Gottschalkia acidurici]AFS77255.1 S-layer domain-containing protein [Gottschalkia acidurici 9a]